MMAMLPVARRLSTALLVATMLSLSACASGPLVRTDSDPTANFTQFRTWGYYQPLSMEQAGYSSWVSDRIKDDVRKEMESRGYRYVPEGGDLLVNFHAEVQDRTNVWTMPQTDVQWVYSHHARGFVAIPFWYDETRVSSYRESTLVVDLVDRARNRLAWSGAASGSEPGRNTPQDKKLAMLDAAVTGIFAKYPHRAAP